MNLHSTFVRRRMDNMISILLTSKHTSRNIHATSCAVNLGNVNLKNNLLEIMKQFT